jgi:hypothetical protein
MKFNCSSLIHCLQIVFASKPAICHFYFRTFIGLNPFTFHSCFVFRLGTSKEYILRNCNAKLKVIKVYLFNAFKIRSSFMIISLNNMEILDILTF